MSIHVRLKDSSIKEIPEGSDVLSLAQGFLQILLEKQWELLSIRNLKSQIVELF